MTLLTIERMTDEKPEELIRISLIRGHVLEALASLTEMRKSKDDLFMLGLFSFIDVLSDTSMDEVIEIISLPQKVAHALRYGEGKYADMLNLIINFERGTGPKAPSSPESSICRSWSFTNFNPRRGVGEPNPDEMNTYEKGLSQNALHFGTVPFQLNGRSVIFIAGSACLPRKSNGRSQALTAARPLRPARISAASDRR